MTGFISGVGRLILLAIYSFVGMAWLSLVLSILLLLFVIAPTYLFGYVAGQILCGICVVVAIWVRPSVYHGLHRWGTRTNFLLVSIVGVLVWVAMTLAISYFGSGYISFTSDVICSVIEWAAPSAADQTVESADVPAHTNRCDTLIAELAPWLSKETSRSLAIATILVFAMFALWRRMTGRARRVCLIERPVGDGPARSQ